MCLCIYVHIKQIFLYCFLAQTKFAGKQYSAYYGIWIWPTLRDLTWVLALFCIFTWNTLTQIDKIEDIHITEGWIAIESCDTTKALQK